MKIRLSKDGRERGLWVFLHDTSAGRAATFRQWADGAAEVACQIMGMPPEGTKRFSAWFAINDEFRQLAKGQLNEGALMEWPTVLAFYEAMGKEIERARERGDLPKALEEHRSGR
ncbi:MAG: hypothetical protein ACTHU0_27870 [Kofleriaceae bacterium]